MNQDKEIIKYLKENLPEEEFNKMKRSLEDFREPNLIEKIPVYLFYAAYTAICYFILLPPILEFLTTVESKWLSLYFLIEVLIIMAVGSALIGSYIYDKCKKHSVYTIFKLNQENEL